jgi:hypothetical protein
VFYWYKQTFFRFPALELPRSGSEGVISGYFRTEFKTFIFCSMAAALRVAEICSRPDGRLRYAFFSVGALEQRSQGFEAGSCHPWLGFSHSTNRNLRDRSSDVKDKT